MFAVSYSDVVEKVGYVATCMAKVIDKGQLQERQVYLFVGSGGEIEFFDPQDKKKTLPYASSFEQAVRFKLHENLLTSVPYDCQQTADEFAEFANNGEQSGYVFGPWEVITVMWVDEVSVQPMGVVPKPVVPEQTYTIHIDTGYADYPSGGIVGVDIGKSQLGLAAFKDGMIALSKSAEMLDWKSIKQMPKGPPKYQSGKDQWGSLKSHQKGKGVK